MSEAVTSVPEESEERSDTNRNTDSSKRSRDVPEDAEEDGSPPCKKLAEDNAEKSASSSEDEDTAKGKSKNKKHMVTLSSGRAVNVKKVRNHVNPLTALYNRPVALPKELQEGGTWNDIYLDPSKPLVLDIGCAKGHYCLEGAKKWPELNWLGLEIREPLVIRGNEWAQSSSLRNLRYINGNASAGMADLLTAFPKGVLKRVCIQCPDPCFKTKHQKRKMVTPRLVMELRDHMPQGSILYVQSDVEMVAQQMADDFSAIGGFTRTDRNEYGELIDATGGVDESRPPHGNKAKSKGHAYCDAKIGTGTWPNMGVAAAPDGTYPWLPRNPYQFQSEREASVLSRGEPMFRMLFVRSGAAAVAKATGSEGAGAGAKE